MAALDRTPSPARSASPTRISYEMREAARQKLYRMAGLGLHVFNPGWNKDGFVYKDDELVRASHFHSATFKECTLKCHQSGETMTIPVQVCTKVWDVKCAVAIGAMVPPESMTFIVKQGCSYRIQNDCEEVHRSVTIRGLVSFAPQPRKYPHPTVFAGAGYNGIRHALLWVHEGQTDFVMYERYDRVGGHAWLVQANKTSKLQTELSAFHVWFGPQWGVNPKLGYPVEWGTWPKKDEVIEHIQHAADRYGIMPHITFRHNVEEMQIIGKLTDPERMYNLTVRPMDGKGDPFAVTTSVLYHFPGAYFNPRIIDYPGEADSGIQVGYGMNDDIPFDYLEGSNVAILGNGAFAVENIRTCMEYGSKKVFLICRKKNLPSPRMCCWFVHQAIQPVPAKMLLNIFIPMFDKGGFGDPWQYHSVYASKDKRSCTISSNSRFGIGDVTFLAVAWGRCEYVIDHLKRCSYHTLHTVAGRKIDDVTVIIKALGLIADFGADRFHKMKEMIGTWPSGDYRRILYCDPLGMHAANFSSFSAGIGSYVNALRDKHLIDFNSEHRLLLDNGTLDMLPKTKATEEKPAHQYDSKHLTTVSMVVDANLPKLQAKMAGVDTYFHRMVWAVNPFDRYYAECKASWDQYQQDWWKMGFEHEYVPYPYTKDMVGQWFEDFRETVGPTEEGNGEYVPRLRGKVVPRYVPSWEREEGEEEPPREEEEEEEPAPAALPAPGAPQEAPAQQEEGAPPPQQEEPQQQLVEAPPPEEPPQPQEDQQLQAYQPPKDPNDFHVVDPAFGSVFNESLWDQGGSRWWWHMVERRGS